MPTDHRSALASIKRFDQLIAYLRDEMGWPIARDSFEDVDDLFYDFTPDELGIDPKTAAKIESIKRLRPLSPRQPWGIFFVKFEPKRLPVVALRRILSQVALKKRVSANNVERTAWAKDDLLFVSNYGEGNERQISFAHFSTPSDGHDLPTLKVLGWDNRDTALHLDAVARELTEHLAWPDNDGEADAWREQWRAAFTLRPGEVVTTSKELSIRLAEVARAIRDRIKTALAIETERGPLTKLMKAFQEALVHDLDADGFADMYAQTITYGLLSARIADPHKKTVDDFAAHMRTNPFLRELMEVFLRVGGRRGMAGGSGIDFDELGVSEVVDLLDDANMEAVVLDFGDRNPQEDPVIHFYERFLKEYDAKKRMQRGVFYTPRPVVSYIVRSVDELLRTKFGLADGLADTATWGEIAKRHKDLKIPDGASPDQDFVQILDPATGTGTFLVEVIGLIHETLVAKWKAVGHGEKKIETLWNEYVPTHLLSRLHGYELLMAPYAIAHLKVGLRLYETGYRFGSEERARIYLTNALEPASDEKEQREFEQWIPALAHEAHAVNAIKRNRRFTVVIGNPPYSLYTANLTEAGDRLIEPFRSIEGEAVRERGALQLEKNLQDDYVKFFGLCLHTLRRTGRGALGFISNHGYLNNRTLRGMRYSLMKFFGEIRLIDLHGSTSRGSAQSREDLDQNVFEIQQGVAVGIYAQNSSQHSAVFYSELVGPRNMKYEWLLAHGLSDIDWNQIQPSPPLYLFEPRDRKTEKEYQAGIALDEIFPVNSTGIVSARDSLVVQFTRSEVELVVEHLSRLTTEDARAEYNLGADTKDWAVSRAQKDVRDALRRKVAVSQILYRPFDVRWTFYTGQARGFMCNPRRPVMAGMVEGKNLALCVNRQVNTEFRHVGATRFLATDCTLSTATKERTYVFPLHVAEAEQGLLHGGSYHLNMSPTFLARIAESLGIKPTPTTTDAAVGLRVEDIFSYIYAILHSPEYRRRYADFLKSDFPRLPLAGSLELFRALSDFGGELLALHLLESPKLDKPLTTYGGSANYEVEKISHADNTVWIDKAQTRGFHGVPEAVWNFHIGGYQVCEKWLKDRKGRRLTDDDVAHYQKIVIALSNTIRVMQDVDEVIERHGGWPGAFASGQRAEQ
jgi:predicted helicase